MFDTLAGISITGGNPLLCAIVATIALTFGQRVGELARRTKRATTLATAGVAPARAFSTICRGDSSFWDDDGCFFNPPSLRERLLKMQGEMITAISAITVAIISPVVAYKIKQKQDAASAKIFKAGLEDTNALMGCISAFAQYGSPRSILWAGHNGGGLPSGGSPFYTTAVHHSIAPGHPNLTGSYSKLLVDSAYVQMLIESIEHMGKSVHMTTTKMKPCQLKDYYIAEEVTASLIIGLGIKDAKYYYLSLARYEGDFSAKERVLCELQARQVWQSLTGTKEAAK